MCNKTIKRPCTIVATPRYTWPNPFNKKKMQQKRTEKKKCLSATTPGRIISIIPK